MALPIQISPSPIVTSTVELRINAKGNIHQIFSSIFSLLQNDLPTVVRNDLPPASFLNTLQKEALKFSAEYVISNEHYSLSIGQNSIAMRNVNEYMLWPNYFSFIKTTLDKIFSLHYIDTINRIGVQYASLFNKVSNLTSVLNSVPSYPMDGYDGKFDTYKTWLKKGDYNLYLQLLNSARFQRNDVIINGAMIDIDASYVKTTKPSEEVYKIIDDLHTEEKVLFFDKLVRADFLATLNPQY